MSVLEKTLQQERYRINYEFGSVGNARIYRAYDTILKTQVVLKEVSQKHHRNTGHLPVGKANFVSEAKILTTIKHDSLPLVHDYFSETDNHYLVLELIDGNDLAQMLENNRQPFTVAQVSRWADQLLGALEYLHRQTPPIIHLAVKPQNIRLTDDGKIRLHTFGDDDISSEQVNAAFMNQTSEISDLPYLPIEQIWKGLDSASQKAILGSYDEKSELILEQPADARTDIYAVGATLYHLLTGTLPTDALTRSIDLLDGKNDPLPKPHQINPSIPESVSQLILHAMEIRRENRFDTATILRRVWRSTVSLITEAEAQEKQRKAEIAAQTAKIAEQQKLEAARQLAEHQRLSEEIQRQTLAEAQSKAELERANAELEKARTEFKRQREAEQIAHQKRLAEQRQTIQKTATTPPQTKTPANPENVSKVPESELADHRIVIKKESKSFPETKEINTKVLQTSLIYPTNSQINDARMNELFSEENSPDNKENLSATNQTDENFNSIFLGQSENTGISRRIAAVAGVFVILCCAAIGIWLFAPPKNAKLPNDTVPAISLNEQTKPVQIIENKPAPTNERISVPTLQPTEETAPMIVPGKADAPKNQDKRPVSAPVAAPHINKQSEPIPAKPTAAKPTAAPKKAVTADDLINDN